MKKLNIPLIVGLMIGTVGLTLGVFLLHGYQVNRSASGLLERADRAAKEGNREEQLKMLRRYLAHRPEDLPQLKTLLKVSREQALAAESVNVRELQMLLEAIERAIRENPEDAELRREGFEFNATVGRWADAIEHAERLSAMNALKPADEVLWATSLYRSKDFNAALEKLADLIGFNLVSLEFQDDKAKSPDNVDAYRYFALIYHQSKSESGDVTVPMKVLDKLVERNAKKPEVYLMRAGFRQSLPEKDEALIAKDIAEAERIGPDNINVIVASAQQAMIERNWPKAETILQRGLEIDPKDPRSYSGLVEVYSQTNKSKEAMAIISQGLAELPAQPDLLLLRASLEIEADDLEHAQETINRIDETKSRNGDARVLILKARMTMAKGDTAKAVADLERLTPLLNDNPSLRNQVTRLLTDGYRRLGRVDKLAEITQANAGDGDETSNAAQVLARAEALQLQGDVEGALALYAELMQKPEQLTPGGRETIFGRVYQLRIQQQKSLPRSQRNWTEVDRMAKVLLDRAEIADELKEHLRIDLLTEKEEPDEARKMAERAVAKFPTQSSFKLLYARLTNDPAQAEALLNQVEQTQGDTAELRIARADRILKDGGPTVIEQLAKLEENAEKLTLSGQMQLWQALASYYYQAGDVPKSVAMLRKTLAKPENEKNVALRQSIFERAMTAGLEDVMDETIKDMAKITGESSSEVSMMNATRQFWRIRNEKADAATIDEVVQAIEKVRASRPDYAAVYLLQAEVHLFQNKPDLAVGSLETALSKRTGDPVILRKLIDVLVRLGRNDDASRYVAQLPADQKQQRDVVSELQLLLSKDPNAAYERMREVVDANTKDPAELILKGEVEYYTRHIEEATKTFARFVEVDPTQPRGWLNYVRCLVESNRKAEAEAAIQRIGTSVPEAERPLLLGQCYTTVGDLQAAAKAYDDGLKVDPDNTTLIRNRILVDVGLKQTDAAHKSLDALLAKTTGTSPADVETRVWSRRLKAQLLANSGPYQDFLKALALLDENINPATGEPYDGDLQLWLNYCAKRPEAESRRKALTRLTSIESRRQLSSGESELMADLYKQDGRWADAKRVMVSLVAGNPNDSKLMSKLLEWLLERGDYDEANVWLNKLDPNSPAVIRFKALLLAKNNKDKDAAKLVLASTPSKLPLASAVVLLEELGSENPSFYKVADAQWKKLVAQNPAAQLNYIEFLTRYPKGEKLADAIEGADAALKKEIAEKDSAGVQTIIKLGLTGLRNNRRFIERSSPLYAQVASWFDLVRESKLVDSVNLTWNEIDYHDIRQDYKRLEPIYQGLLNDPTVKDFDKALIRNNLAYGYAITNQGDKALDAIGDAISQLGPRSDFLDTRGLAYLSSNKVDLALKDLHEAVAGGDGSASTYFHLALAEWKGKNTKEAQEALARASQLGLSETDLSPSEIALLKQLREALKGAKTNTKPAANKNADGTDN